MCSEEFEIKVDIHYGLVPLLLLLATVVGDITKNARRDMINAVLSVD